MMSRILMNRALRGENKRANTRLPKRRTQLFISALLLLLTLSNCSTEAPPNPAPAEAAPLAIRTATVAYRDLRHELRYIGTLHARHEIRILARIAGTLHWLAPEGSQVAQGERLALVSADEMSSKLARIDAEVQRVTAEHELRCTTYERDRKLGEAQAIPPAKVEMSRSACDSATAALDAVRASAKEARVGNQKTRENAPIDGRVLQRLAEAGQNIMPGVPLLLFGGQDAEIRVPVTQTDLVEKIAPGTPARVHLGQQVLELSVSEVAPLARGPGGIIEVRIHLPEGVPSSLRTGISTRVDFVLAEQKNALAIPESALAQVGAKNAVFVVDGQTVQQLLVEPGIREDGWVQVQDELAEGTQVAASNLDMLKDGARVFAVSPKAHQEVSP